MRPNKPAEAMYEYDRVSGEEPARDKQTALGYVTEAFAEAELDGVDGDYVVQAALFAAFRHLVQVYGEESAAVYAEGLPERIRSGAYSTGHRH